MKRLTLIFTFLLCIFTLASCGTIEETISGTKLTTTKSSSNETTTNPSDTIFTVTLMWMGQPMPVSEDIEVIWMNRTTEKRAKVSEDGVAETTGLDGEFNVHLSQAPKGYTYDPNQTIVSNDSPNAEIEIMKISKAKGLGTNLYSNIATISNITIKDKNNYGESYSYQAVLKESDSSIYYEFTPKSAGVYTIESMVDVNDDRLNPYVEIFYGTSAYKNPIKILDDGGYSKKGGYTKNFLYEYSIAEEEIGGVAAFRIFAEAKDGVFPSTVDFIITYVSFYEIEHADVTQMYAEDIYAKRDSTGNIIYTTNASGEKVAELNYILDEDRKKSQFNTNYNERDVVGVNMHGIGKLNSYVTGLPEDDSDNYYVRKRYVKNPDGSYTENYAKGTYVLVSPIECKAYGSKYQDFLSYSGFQSGKYRILDGTRCIYNEADGYYHFDSLNGPIICAKITKNIPGFDLALTHAEDPGNSCLRVFGTENYKRFIEGEYAEICNSDGICYVTKELKEFLQKYSNSSNLFFDGNGWCETNNTYAEEEHQWLFACGFYYA